MTLTPKQTEGRELLKSKASRFLFYGGSRSGKTYLIICAILVRALQYPGSRHLIARLRYSHARGSIWLDTLRSAVSDLGMKDVVSYNETDHYVTVKTDGGSSEIWVDGLDDKERVEKILGREYNTIFLNEVSQIAYPTVTTVMTRLALKVEGCRNYAVFDCNPPSKFHWTYKMFIQGVDPESGDPLDMSMYGSIKMNPVDNQEHLPDGYIRDILEHLPEDQKRRFLRGEFGDAQGVVFKDWSIVDEIPEEAIRRGKESYGLDFGFTVHPSALIQVIVYGKKLYFKELIYADDLTNQALGRIIKEMDIKNPIYADSAEPKSITELRLMHLDIRKAKKGPDSVRQGIDWLLSKELYILRSSVNIQMEFQNYAWRQNRDGKSLSEPIDDFNHAIDAIRYATEVFKYSQKAEFSAKDLGL